MVLLVCLSLLGYCLVLARFSLWPIEYTPFFVISCCITVLYIFAYGHFLQNGANGILIVGWLLLLASIFFIKNCFQKYFTPGFVISLLFLIVFLLLASKGHLSYWDEFAQWGPHDKLVYFNNGFFTTHDVTTHKSYPLGGALFHYLFFRLDGFHEGTAYVAQALLLMAPLSILISDYKWSAWRTAFIVYGITLLILLALHVRVGITNSLYMDHAVGVYVGMSIVAYLACNKKWSIIFYLMPSIIALTLFKQKLLPLVCVIAFTILLDQIIIAFREKKPAWKWRAILFLPIISFFTTQSWHHYLKMIHVPIEWKMHITLSKLTVAFSAPVDSSSYILIHHYLYASRSLLLFLFAIIVISAVAYILYAEKNKKNSLLMIQIILLIGMVMYLSGLLLMYLFAFDAYEAMELASMNRYISIYEIAWALVTVYFFFDALHISQKQNRAIEYGIIIFICAAIAGLTFTQYSHEKSRQLMHQGSWAVRQPIIQIANAVKKIIAPNAKIFTVWQDSRGNERGMLNYELTPQQTNVRCTSFGKPYFRGDVWTCHVTQKQFLKQLKNFQYLLLGYTDNNFWSHYGTLIPHNKKLKSLVTYSICHDHYFSSFGAPGCHMETHHAYLFKIIKGKLYAES